MATELDQGWTGEGVTIGQVEGELAKLRAAIDGQNLRTSVMTHIAWVPERWRDAAVATLAGMAERHPSRTILLVPDPDAGESRIDARLSLERFALGGAHISSEVIELRLLGARTHAPASVVAPLLVSDLPVFCRWRGEPPWGAPEWEQLVDVIDRLVVYSGEWDDLPYAYTKLAAVLERTAVSDIAWSRTLDWRRALAGLWPAIGEAGRLRIRGPQADALLLAGWLRTRLGLELELDWAEAETVTEVAVDGTEVAPPRGQVPDASDLLSAELDHFGHDRIYEETIRGF
ncbi:MAG: glucose-6-phosphate dehydrogenase assembly protein OpcA [Gaiellaceae bacterium]